MTLPIRSRARIANMTQLLATLVERDVTVQQVADLLGLTHAGAKKYIRQLRLAGLVAIIGRRNGIVGHPAPIYRIHVDQAGIEKYLASQRDIQPLERAKPPRSTNLDRAMQDPTRHIHLMQDDAYHPPSVKRFTPFRDSLVAALFGAPGAPA